MAGDAETGFWSSVGWWGRLHAGKPMASVPPLDARPVSKYAKNAVFHCRRVRPRRAISVTGQVGKVSTTRSAIRRPSTGLGCRYAARSRGRRSRRARPQGAPRWRRSRQRAVASVGRKVLGAGAEQHPDPVQPITLAAAVSAGGLLDPAAARIDGASAKLDDVERIERGRGRAWSQITPARGTSARLRRRRPPAALRRTGAGALAPSAGAGSRALEPATGPEPRQRS
jgi:hypothetical protein